LPGLDVTVRLGGQLKRETPIDDGLDLARFDQRLAGAGS
jgi:hypothetical protein